ncbi:hypothetical protein A3Q56_07545 [Intoshia linei]|uniref:Uncharacterized protein n=1 Tax=Intoshia linei TaxID=1819745 RepID=A0A177AU42_9BILA|nr:hypothetical protein A3Q56_07545 [Intoshia linei]
MNENTDNTKNLFKYMSQNNMLTGIGISKKFQKEADAQRVLDRKNCIKYIVPQLDSKAVPYSAELFKRISEQVDPLIVASYMYLLAKTNFGSFIENKQARLENFIETKNSNHTLENPIDHPDVSKYTYGILLYYISHLRIKKDSCVDMGNYKAKTS